MTTPIRPKNERLENLLGGLTSGTLEFNSLNNDINLIKTDLTGLGYQITYECEDKERKLYHLHIRKRRI